MTFHSKFSNVADPKGSLNDVSTWMSQEVSKWLVNGLKPTLKWGIFGLLPTY